MESRLCTPNFGLYRSSSEFHMNSFSAPRKFNLHQKLFQDLNNHLFDKESTKKLIK